MNIVDYIIFIILLLHVLKGFKNGLLPTLINFIGMFLVFIIAFYLKTPISIYLYENLPFLSFGGIFKGIVAINILFYEAIAYGLSIILLGIIFTVVKRLSKIIERIIKLTVLLNLPSKILGGIVGFLEGVLYIFILLYIASVVNTLAPYVKDSKYSSIILNKTPIISNVTSDLINSGNEIYNSIIKNKNNTNKANLESIDILMKYEILSYDSANKLINDNKLYIKGIENIVSKYKEVNND